MKMVPSSVLEFQSSAEQRVFRMLEQVNFGPADVALHSLNLGRHKYKRWGEIDFLLVTRKGIVALEVKGGRVACRNGIWEYTNRFGEVTRRKESPASQAGSAFFSLMDNYLKPRFRRDLDTLPAGWALLFEGIERVVSTGASKLPELPDEITGYKTDCAGHNSLKAYLSKVLDHWSDQTKGSKRQVHDGLISDIVSFLRPNFEQVPPLNSQLQEFDKELCELSEEQIRRLDELQENDRMSIFGGAGTGKTFLAMATARYDAAEGKTVLLVTRSRFLASFLMSHELPESIRVCCLEDLSAETAENGKRDVLVIDEGQDLCQIETLEKLGGALHGGLEEGRWRWFGDPNNQLSTAYPFDDFAFDYIRNHSFTRRLLDNIRNAPPIVDSMTSIAEVDLGTPRALGIGSEVKVVRVNAAADIPPRCASIVAKIVSGNQPVQRSDVAVLLAGDGDIAAVVKELESAGVRAEPLSKRALSGRRRDCVLVSTAEEFKGLERPVICVAGLGDPRDGLSFKRGAYLAFSRANHTLQIVCTEQQASLLSELQIERQRKKIIEQG
ncbi:MAG: NERD domain-containing protein [Paracoccaceae bacterium]